MQNTTAIKCQLIIMHTKMYLMIFIESETSLLINKMSLLYMQKFIIYAHINKKIKIIFFLGQASPEQLEEFSSEIATMRRAGRHRNIVQLLGTCTVNECLVMIMEHIPCGDLVSNKSEFMARFSNYDLSNS